MAPRRTVPEGSMPPPSRAPTPPAMEDMDEVGAVRYHEVLSLLPAVLRHHFSTMSTNFNSMFVFLHSPLRICAR